MSRKLLKVPRYVPEGVRNYNGRLYEPKSLNESMDRELKTKHFYVFKYIPQEERINSEQGFFYNDLHDVIGIVKTYDAENLYVVLDEWVEFKNPVALISVIGDKPKGDPSEMYNVRQVLRIEIVEEDDLDHPRIRK